MRWLHTKHGNHTVKSVYAIIASGNNIDESAHVSHTINYKMKIWNEIKNLRIQLFTWKCYENIVATNEKLNSIIIDVPNLCCFCKSVVETREHIFINCEFARAIWYATHACIRNTYIIGTYEGWLENWFTTSPTDWDVDWCFWANFCATECWYLWKAKCNQTFNNIRAEPILMIRQIYSSLKPISDSSMHDKIDVNLDPSLQTVIINDSMTKTQNNDIRIGQNTNICLAGQGSTNIGNGNSPQFRQGWKPPDIGTCRGVRGASCRVETVDKGEAMAAKTSIEWVEEMELTNVIIEGDSSNIINFLNNSFNEEKLIESKKNILTKFRSISTTGLQYRFFVKVT